MQLSEKGGLVAVRVAEGCKPLGPIFSEYLQNMGMCTCLVHITYLLGYHRQFTVLAGSIIMELLMFGSQYRR